MAGRDGKKQARSANVGRRMLVGMGAGVGVFFAAAAMATGSAAPAKADFEELLDPIIQPLLTSLTDSIGAFDPAAALDLTSWTDSFLASLNSIDLAVPAASEPAAAVAAASPASDPVSGTYDIPITVQEDTEPTVQAAIGSGPDQTLLVDTGSSGLVVPYTDLGDNIFTQLQELFSLGSPETFGISGYSGGVEYVYGVYNEVPVDYLDGSDTVLATNGPVDVELFSWSNNLSDPFENFQSFLSSNDVDGILGVGAGTAGPTTTPFADYGSVLVDIPNHQLVIGEANPFPDAPSTAGAGVSDVYEQIGTGAQKEVTNIIDSGGVFGTIPSSLETGSSVPAGTLISVYNTDHDLLYSYTTTGNFDVGTGTGVSDSPTVVSGTNIDSGVLPFLDRGVYIDYAGAGTTFFGPLVGN